MLFASSTKGGTEQQVQAYSMRIKDNIQVIQKGSDELEKLLND